MLDLFMPMRMAQGAAELALRNATTGLTMWSDLTRQTLDQSMSMWSNMALPIAEAVMPLVAAKRTTRSWYRHPDDVETPFGRVRQVALNGMPAAAPFAPFLDAMRSFAPAGAAFAPAASMTPRFDESAALAPLQTWMKMMAAPAGTPAWPMAFALMACGMPQRAAWSTAEAGAHANEASRKAAEGLEQMFSTYRSDGGHAIAQILWAGRGQH